MDVETYPFEELVNELAGIAGMYFGFSVITVAVLISVGIDAIRAAYAKYKGKVEPIPNWSNLQELIK